MKITYARVVLLFSISISIFSIVYTLHFSGKDSLVDYLLNIVTFIFCFNLILQFVLFLNILFSVQHIEQTKLNNKINSYFYIYSLFICIFFLYFFMHIILPNNNMLFFPKCVFVLVFASGNPYFLFKEEITE